MWRGHQLPLCAGITSVARQSQAVHGRACLRSGAAGLSISGLLENHLKASTDTRQMDEYYHILQIYTEHGK